MKRLIDSLVVHQIRVRRPTYVPRRSAVRLSILTAFGLVSQTIGQEAPKPAQPTPSRSMREIVMMPVVFRIAGMDRVTIKSNLKYTEVNNPHLLMDVYHPPNLAKNERHPAVLFIHGGAGAETTPKDWGIYTSWGRLVAASGLIGVTFTHRLSAEKTSLEDAASDLAAAINYIRSNADSLNIDKARICLAAYSAGGALLSSAMRDKPEYIRCMAGFYAFMDIRQTGNLFAANESPETLKKFSPITYLANNSDKIAPFFIARAGAIKSRQWMIRLIVSSEKQLQRISRSRSPITRKGFMDLTTRTTTIVRGKLFKARLLS